MSSSLNSKSDDVTNDIDANAVATPPPNGDNDCMVTTANDGATATSTGIIIDDDCHHHQRPQPQHPLSTKSQPLNHDDDNHESSPSSSTLPATPQPSSTLSTIIPTLSQSSTKAIGHNNNNKKRRRLDFSRIKHCGRQREMQQLAEALERSIRHNNRCNTNSSTCTTTTNNNNYSPSSSSSTTITVIVEAESGVGKSSLVDHFIETHLHRHPSQPLLGRGKFEEVAAATEPFAAIVELVDTIVRDMLQRQEGGELWLRRMVQAVGAEIFILLEIIPGLARLGDAHKVLQAWNEMSSSSSSSKRGTTKARVSSSAAPSVEEEASVSLSPSPLQYSQQRQHLNRHPSATVSNASSASSSINLGAFGDMAKKEWRFERFRIAFRELMACISKHHPLVLILDDLQFAEKDSLALIQAIMENTTPDLQLLFLCATRPTNDLILSLRSFYDRNASGGPQGLFIKLWELSELEVCDILQVLLELPTPQEQQQRQQFTPDIRKLAHIIIEKTQGNAFVVTHFLRQLELDGLIQFDETVQHFIIDIPQLTTHLNGSSSESVEQVIVKNLQSLDDFQRSLLMTAASFGASQFDLVVVLQAMEALQRSDSVMSGEVMHESVLREQLSQVETLLLETSVQHGLLEKLSYGHFKFSHDRIREAAYTLLPKGEARNKMHLKIGRQLRRWMDAEAEFGTSLTDESIIMHAAKHSSLGYELVVDTWERLEIAELDYTAAELSARKAAFFPAMAYLRDGISVLGSNAWEKHFESCLKLHVALTRIQFNCGLLEDCQQTATIVIEHARSFGQKKDVYNQKLLCLLQQERAMEAVDLCLLILQGLGYKPPKRFITLYVIGRYLKAERFLKKVSDDDIRNIPEFSDKVVDDQLSVLYRLGELTFFGAPAVYLNLFSVDVVMMLKEKGNHPLVTPMGLMVWVTVQIVEGNFAESRRFCSLSMEMAKKLCLDYPATELRIKNLCRFFGEAWYGPLQESVRAMLADNRAVLELGGMEEYHLEGVNAARFSFFCGRPLTDVRMECESYMGVLRDYNREFLCDICTPLAQVVACFMGETTAPSLLAGEILDAATLTRIEQSKVDTGRFQYQLYSMILAFHFGEMKEAAAFEQAMRKDLYAEGSEPPGLSTRVFYTVLVYLALFRQSKRYKHKRKARSSYKIMESWVAKGATNCTYMKLILDAEWCSINPKKNVEMVLQKFDQAVESAKKMGVLHHEALACELACNYLHPFQFIAKDKKLSFLKRSLACYQKWGGHAKVQALKFRHKQLLAEGK